MKKEHLELVDKLVSYYRQSLIDGLMETDEASKKYIDARTKFEIYITVICDHFLIDRETMMQTHQTRREDYRQARQILWLLCREGDTHLGMSLARIGEWSGGFDHATVRHGRNKMLDEVEVDYQTRKVVNEVCDILGYQLLKVGANYTTREKQIVMKYDEPKISIVA